MNKISFYVPMDPPTCTHQEKKVSVVKGKPVFYEPPELVAARSSLMARIGKHKIQDKLIGPLKLSVSWRFYSEKHPEGKWRSTKPDTDNLQKLLKDVMTDLGFWKDDAQVCIEQVEKMWSQKYPGIVIEIEKLEE